MKPLRKRSFRKGFTLIEAAIAACIVGVGVASLMAVAGACTRATDGGSKLSQAVFLAQEIREWTLHLPFADPDAGEADNTPGPDLNDPDGSADDLDDLMSVTYSPPVGGDGWPLQGEPGWSQAITLTWVNPDDLTPVQPGASDAVQVEVNVSFHGRPVFTTGWLVIGR